MIYVPVETRVSITLGSSTVPTAYTPTVSPARPTSRTSKALSMQLPIIAIRTSMIQYLPPERSRYHRLRLDHSPLILIWRRLRRVSPSLLGQEVEKERVLREHLVSLRARLLVWHRLHQLRSRRARRKRLLLLR